VPRNPFIPSAKWRTFAFGDAILDLITRDRGLCVGQESKWATDADEVEFDKVVLAERLDDDSYHAVGFIGEVAAYVQIERGTCTVHLRAANQQALALAQVRARELLPLSEASDQMVDFSFWHHTNRGPASLRRRLAVPRWEEISANYAAKTAEQLTAMFNERPGEGGKLLVWHGLPGTGKTWALRALSWEWRDWCDCHYVIDPESFFGTSPADLLEVVTGGDEDDRFERRKDPARWKLLILEDCGEMLRVDAKAQLGQALSRLLNLVDGLIGQGLHVMALVTTNEELGELHEAVTRPGRCAAKVDFQPLSRDEANRWLSHVAGDDVRSMEVSGERTLADLYALAHSWWPRPRRRSVGFRVTA